MTVQRYLELRTDAARRTEGTGVQLRTGEQMRDFRTVNRNAVPFDTRSPFVTSGIRIGTPAVTTRGLKEAEMTTIGNLIARVLGAVNDEAVLKMVAQQVAELCGKFPVYPHRLEKGQGRG